MSEIGKVPQKMQIADAMVNGMQIIEYAPDGYVV